MKEIISELIEHELSYEPNDEVRESLSQKNMVLVIGPLAVGKSTCIDYITQQDPDFGRVRSFTTRPKRPGEPDDLYRYLPHNTETIESISSQVKNRELVQYAVHPTTGHVYGSDLLDYAHEFMLLDTLSSGVAQIEKLPFKSVTRIALTCPPIQWLSRYEERRQQLHGLVLPRRLVEAENSLEWSLAQKDEIFWVNNPDGKAAVAAEEIIGLARGTKKPNTLNRVIGMHLLHALK